MANLNGYAPQIAVEFGRKTIFSSVRPGFVELENHIKGKPA
jgi:chemotaxis protein MotA